MIANSNDLSSLLAAKSTAAAFPRDRSWTACPRMTSCAKIVVLDLNQCLYNEEPREVVKPRLHVTRVGAH